MGRLTNDRHEAFAQHVARGSSAVEAMKAAGFRGHRQNAHRLMTNDDVQSRIAELQDRAAANTVITREWVIEQLVDNARQAKQQGDIAPANKAIELLGKELGMFVERTENVNINHDVSDEPLSEDEWATTHARPN
jgi:phage terminase small subunit